MAFLQGFRYLDSSYVVGSSPRRRSRPTTPCPTTCPALITTDQLVTQWGAAFGDEVFAAAILHRLLHRSQNDHDRG
jgi:hypothetical protein